MPPKKDPSKKGASKKSSGSGSSTNSSPASSPKTPRARAPPGRQLGLRRMTGSSRKTESRLASGVYERVTQPDNMFKLAYDALRKQGMTHAQILKETGIGHKRIVDKVVPKKDLIKRNKDVPSSSSSSSDEFASLRGGPPPPPGGNYRRYGGGGPGGHGPQGGASGISAR